MQKPTVFTAGEWGQLPHKTPCVFKYNWYTPITDEISVSKITTICKNPLYLQRESGAAAPQNALRFQVQWVYYNNFVVLNS